MRTTGDGRTDALVPVQVQQKPEIVWLQGSQLLLQNSTKIHKLNEMEERRRRKDAEWNKKQNAKFDSDPKKRTGTDEPENKY